MVDAVNEVASSPVLPVVVIGAGPVGLATAIDLAQRGIETLLLDEDDRVSPGSRAICFAKRTLEVFDRLKCAVPVVEKGVGWNVGKVFFKDRPIYSFDLLPEQGHQFPAFVNIQQYYVEEYLQRRASQCAGLTIRWGNKVIDVTAKDDAVRLRVEGPQGTYEIAAQYVVAADGSRSSVRRLLGLESRGRVFKDRFLIVDVQTSATFPTERWFWFDPPFHPNQSVLLHRQPDNVWRIDFQLGWDADPVAERDPDRIMGRVRALLGEGVDFTLVWTSIYSFACSRMNSFRHGRVLFAGDAAHGVSPFGARGANSGVQDADNLAWKLALVVSGQAPDALLQSYCVEREQAADENILHSTRSTDFITPKSPVSRIFRDAVLSLAADHPFARRLVNAGRLSTPTTYINSPLSTLDEATFAAGLQPGAPCIDAPIKVASGPAWLLGQLDDGFTALFFVDGPVSATQRLDIDALAARAIPVRVILVLPAEMEADAAFECIEDVNGLVKHRMDAAAGSLYLIRPDQHIAARWSRFDFQRISMAVDAATCVRPGQAEHA